jgi:two-component system, cell cycle response regulator
MTASRRMVIDFAGLKPNEVSVLKSVCMISRQVARHCGFEVASNAAPAEILVLDSTGAAAPAMLVGPAIRAVLWIGQEAPLGRALPNLVVQRPLLASRMLSTLDKLVDALAAKAAESANTAKPALPEPPAFNPLVLVVDDSPTVRKQVELVLAGLEAQVLSVASGEGALDMLKQQRFDLVLLDVVLPGADGYSVCRTIKRDPQMRMTPVVMLTSKSSPFDKIRGTLAGCENYLTKPVTKDDFERTVLRYLQPPADAFQRAARLRPASAV